MKLNEMHQMSEMKEMPRRNYWPWLLVSIPFTAVIFGIFMVTLTAFYPDDLVVDDYYREGMAINRRLDTDENARQLRVKAILISSEKKHLEIAIENVKDAAIEMSLFHVTDKTLDRHFILLPDGGEIYTSQSADLTVLQEIGVWYIELVSGDGKWRLRKRIQTPLQGLEIGANE